MIKVNCAVCDKLLIEIEDGGKITYKGGFGIKCITCMEQEGMDKVWNNIRGRGGRGADAR